MKFLLTSRALRDYERLSLALQKSVDKQLALLVKNPRHPSLRAKKYDEMRGIWQARVSRSYRLYFVIKNGIYKIITIISHPK